MSGRTPLHLAAMLHAAGWRGHERAQPWGADGDRPAASAVDGSVARPSIADAVRPLARANRQQDATTCGSAVLTMLAAVGDPGLAGWIATGRAPEGRRPPELAGAPPEALARLADAGPVERARAVHRVVRRRTARVAPPWPTALGTSPWGAAAVARFPGVRWTHHPLGGAASVRAHLDRVGRWVGLGVPVPLYSGGDLRGGWRAAVPRHVVLVVGHRRGLLDVWEPAAGAVVSTSLDRLASGGGPLPALGGWSRVVWALVPRWEPWRSDAARARMGADPGPE